MTPSAFYALVVLQAVQVIILWLHDWAPVPPLNDVAAVRRENPFGRLLVTTAIQSAPYTVGLVGTLISGPGAPLHGWVRAWLWISYSICSLASFRRGGSHTCEERRPSASSAIARCSAAPTPSCRRGTA